MGHWRRGVLAILVALPTAACSSASPPAAAPTTAGHPAPVVAPLRAGTRMTLPASPLTPDQQTLHARSRLGYGPRPGDVERVRRIGLAAYVDEQLSPSALADSAVEQALPAYPVLARSAADLVREYLQPAAEVPKRLAPGRMSREAAAEMYPPERRPAVITAQMQAARVTRAVLSERQLEEVLVDFWFNHFNVYAQKGAVRWMLPAYEREAIRPHVLGHFRELVLATARHPAMLFYLDNWLSTRADLVVPRGPNAGRRAGLNENYARELMELHTLGVDGGYTQQDVVEVARCFTGWTIDRPQQGGGFVFRTATHDRGEKRVLGQVIPAGGGREDGDGGMVWAREVARLGEPLYEAQPPTGYPDRAESWVNTGALLGRMNFALGLAHNRLRGARVALAGAVAGADRGQPAQVLDRLLAAVLHGEASPATRAVLAAELESPEITRVTPYHPVAKDTDLEKLAPLVLGSPEFQPR